MYKEAIWLAASLVFRTAQNEYEKLKFLLISARVIDLKQCLLLNNYQIQMKKTLTQPDYTYNTNVIKLIKLNHKPSLIVGLIHDFIKEVPILQRCSYI